MNLGGFAMELERLVNYFLNPIPYYSGQKKNEIPLRMVGRLTTLLIFYAWKSPASSSFATRTAAACQLGPMAEAKIIK